MQPSSFTRRRLTFSFDSSGWLYVYHLGAAHYIQTQLMPHLPEDELSFSGSSGGALVACALCTGISIEELARFIIDRQPECRFNPWRMLPCVESATERFLPDDAASMAQGRLRVLLTRVQFGWMRPLLWPEVVSRFASRDELAQVLRASCHIPVLGGLLPFRIPSDEAEPGGKGGKGKGALYYDGLFWPSVLWAWRAFHASDTLLKVSGLGWPTAHVGPPVPMPLHWVVLPPSQVRMHTTLHTTPCCRPRRCACTLHADHTHRKHAPYTARTPRAHHVRTARTHAHCMYARCTRTACARCMHAACMRTAALAVHAVAPLRAGLPRHRPLLVGHPRPQRGRGARRGPAGGGGSGGG